MRSMLRNNSLSYVQNTSAATASETAMRKNISTPQFGRLARINSNASYAASIERRDSTNLVYGVQDGAELFLQPRSAVEQLRRPSQAPILRPLSRKDIFYSGSIINIALPPPLPDCPPPPMAIEDDKNDDMDSPGTFSRYRYSIVSIPKFGGISELHRGSIVTSHLDIAPAVSTYFHINETS